MNPTQSPRPLSLAEAKSRYRADAAWSTPAEELGIEPRYRRASFETCTQTKAIRAVYAYCATDDYACRAMAIRGGVGAGKTTALSCAARWWKTHREDEHIELRFWGRLITDLLSPDRRAETMQRLTECDLVLLDDVGASHTSAFVVALFEELVITWEAQYQPLIMTTNLLPAMFRQRFGDRVFSRLKGEWGAWIDVGDRDLRTKSRVAL